jgi:hypothetical protein
VQEHDEVLSHLHRWLCDEFSPRGRFLFDSDCGTIVGLPQDLNAPLLLLTKNADGILVQLGLGLMLTVPFDEPFDFNDIVLPIRALIERGIVVYAPCKPSGPPTLRYTLSYEGGILSTKVPEREYIEIPMPGWTVVTERPS